MFTCTIKADGAAYRDENENLDTYELRENLYTIAAKIKSGYRSGSIMDINGNKVGTWELDD